MFHLPVRNGTYVIPVRSNGKFLPVLTALTGNATKGNVPSSVPHLKSEINEGTKGSIAQQQVLLLPVLMDARMFQATPAHSQGFGSGVRERPRGVRDVAICFTARGMQMCVRTDLFAGKVTALARSLKEKDKRARKLWLRRKYKMHHKSSRSWKDDLKEIFWPSRPENKPLPPSSKYTIDILTFRNLSLWRSIRWERVAYATGLGSDATAADKLKQMLQTSPEKNVTTQAVKDILFLHELLELTNWTTDTKWDAFEKGLSMLVTRETTAEPLMRDRQNIEPDWGPKINSPQVLVPKKSERTPAFDKNSDTKKDSPYSDLLKVNTFKHTATKKGNYNSKRQSIGSSVYGTESDWKDARGRKLGYYKFYARPHHPDGQGVPDMWLRNQSITYANRNNVRYKKRYTRSQIDTVVPPWIRPHEIVAIYENMILFNTTSRRLSLFAQAVRFGTLKSEYGWKLLTLGFNMFSNKTHIMEGEMKAVINKLPGFANGTQFQAVMNSMIVYDLLILNGTSDYDSWMKLEWQRFTITLVPSFSRKVQSLLSMSGSLKLIGEWYIVQLSELIMMKLTMLSLNASYTKDIDALLSKNPDVGVTPQFIESQKDFLKNSGVSLKILQSVYDSDLSSKMFSSLIYVNNSDGSCVEPAKNIPPISLTNMNNTEALAEDVDAILYRVEEISNTQIGDICTKELFLLKLLTMTPYDEAEVAWRDIIVMKWTNMTDMEGAAREAFSPATEVALRLYTGLNESAVNNLIKKELKSFVPTDNVTEQAEAAMHDKLINVTKNFPFQARNVYSMNTYPMQAAGPTEMSIQGEIVDSVTTGKFSTGDIIGGSQQGLAATSTVDAIDDSTGTPASQ
ncbi:uncharacterized protein LOC142766032 [Rhipicephalus microplus]|uniref:uncharacterized protein LOC142766032 n=1 Tax=Rhipicephalus microplus TaxID=6941 RepID=UPI003F6CFB34